MSRNEHQSVKPNFTGVLEALLQFAPPIVCDQVKFIVEDARSLIDVGEEGIAFENLVENLHEIDYPLSAALVSQIAELGRTIGADPSTWSVLDAGSELS